MEAIVTQLAGSGATGLGFAVGIMTIRHLYKQVQEVQEKRISEGRENLTALNANTNALNALSQRIKGDQ